MFVVLAALFDGAFVTGTAGSIIIIVAAAIGAYMAINIGANDVTNNVGPAGRRQGHAACRRPHRCRYLRDCRRV